MTQWTLVDTWKKPFAEPKFTVLLVFSENASKRNTQITYHRNIVLVIYCNIQPCNAQRKNGIFCSVILAIHIPVKPRSQNIRLSCGLPHLKRNPRKSSRLAAADMAGNFFSFGPIAGCCSAIPLVFYRSQAAVCTDVALR